MRSERFGKLWVFVAINYISGDGSEIRRTHQLREVGTHCFQRFFFPWWLFGISEPSTVSVDLTPQPQDANRGK